MRQVCIYNLVRTAEEEDESVSWGSYEQEGAWDEVLGEEPGEGRVERFVAGQEFWKRKDAFSTDFLND